MTLRTWLAAVASGLVLLGCGGGGGGGGGNKSPGTSACQTLCTQLSACATSLSTDLATLTGDESMTSSNCVTECAALTCTDASSFVSCASDLTCSSLSAVQTTLNSCSENAGCHGGGGGGGGGGGSGPYIVAMVLSMSDGSAPPFGFSEQVRVCSDSSCSSRISDATVTVNGSPVSWDSMKDEYRGTVNIAAGASVTISVSTGGSTYTATGTQYSTAPTISGSMPTTWTASSANTISWSGGSPTTGAAYFVGVLDQSGTFLYPTGDHGPQEVSISSTSQSVPAGTLSAGSDVVMIGIGSIGLASQASGGISIPNAASGSGLWLGLIKQPFTAITVN